MKKNTLKKIHMLLLYGLTLPLLAQGPDHAKRPSGPDGPREGVPSEKIMKMLSREQVQQKLELSEDQQTAIKALQEEYQEKNRSLRRETRDLRFKVRDLLEDRAGREAILLAVEQAGEAHIALQKHNIGLLLDLRDILTEQQEETLREMTHRRMRPNGRGPIKEMGPPEEE